MPMCRIIRWLPLIRLDSDCAYLGDDGNAYILTGDCDNVNDNGYYVDGTITGVTLSDGQLGIYYNPTDPSDPLSTGYNFQKDPYVYSTGAPYFTGYDSWSARNSGIAAQIEGAVKQVLRKIGNVIQVPCGAGAFAYGGGRASGGLASVGMYGIGAWDSRTGTSKGGFTDITVGEGIQAGYGFAAYGDGAKEHFGFLGLGADAVIGKASFALYGSHVEGDGFLRNQFGINVDVGVGDPGLGGGVGIGVNTDSLTSCVDHNLH